MNIILACLITVVDFRQPGKRIDTFPSLQYMTMVLLVEMLLRYFTVRRSISF